MKLYSIDLFSGVGGLTQGLRKAGFQTKMAFEIDELASSVYKLNHKRTKVITDNIRNVSTEKVKKTVQRQNDSPPCRMSTMSRF